MKEGMSQAEKDQRQRCIEFVEGVIGSLDSIPYWLISTEDLLKLEVGIYELWKEAGYDG